jgi:phage terminase large subunit-like protein
MWIERDPRARLSPERWAARAIAMYQQFKADRIICEQNYGGAMVEHTVRMVDPRVGEDDPGIQGQGGSRRAGLCLV